MRVGFTGTRKGMTGLQQQQVVDTLGMFRDVAGARRARAEFHHGGAVGADSQAAAQARCFGFYIVCYPAGTDPLRRNRDIVAACDILIAAPETDTEERRSGTWSTIRYARTKGIPVVMLSRGTR